jgi:hypothetical protein
VWIAVLLFCNPLVNDTHNTCSTNKVPKCTFLQISHQQLINRGIGWSEEAIAICYWIYDLVEAGCLLGSNTFNEEELLKVLQPRPQKNKKAPTVGLTTTVQKSESLGTT